MLCCLTDLLACNHHPIFANCCPALGACRPRRQRQQQPTPHLLRCEAPGWIVLQQPDDKARQLSIDPCQLSVQLAASMRYRQLQPSCRRVEPVLQPLRQLGCWHCRPRTTCRPASCCCPSPACPACSLRQMLTQLGAARHAGGQWAQQRRHLLQQFAGCGARQQCALQCHLGQHNTHRPEVNGGAVRQLKCSLAQVQSGKGARRRQRERERADRRYGAAWQVPLWARGKQNEQALGCDETIAASTAALCSSRITAASGNRGASRIAAGSNRTKSSRKRGPPQEPCMAASAPHTRLTACLSL